MAEMTKKQKEFAALAPPFNKATQADRIAGATKGKKQYNNGQRSSAMYGGGTVRKPMMMGGLAEQNRNQTSTTPKATDSMGMMTQQKKFGMGYDLGGSIKKFKG
tara:strand:+ start:503 stop:814 length:312 start_codon:yes stop_codon:yes gene_type:complete